MFQRFESSTIEDSQRRLTGTVSVSSSKEQTQKRIPQALLRPMTEDGRGHNIKTDTVQVQERKTEHETSCIQINASVRLRPIGKIRHHIHVIYYKQIRTKQKTIPIIKIHS